MISTSTPQFGPDFLKDFTPWMIEQFGIATAKVFRMLWDIGMTYLAQHLVVVLSGLLVLFLFTLVRAVITGRWGMLGSIIYNYLYFGTLFIIGSIWGPEVFANDYFKIVLLLLYITCFIITGKILRKTGIRRY